MYAATVRGLRLTFDAECVWRRNMIMRDRETGTLWQHATGEALVGPLKGAQLELLGGVVLNWSAWKEANPQTVAALEPERWEGILPRPLLMTVLERATTVAVVPGLTPDDERLHAHDAVIGISIDDAPRAYPMVLLQRMGVIEESFDGKVVRLAYDASGEQVSAWVDGNPISTQKTWWMGWHEFHPQTTLYEPG